MNSKIVLKIALILCFLVGVVACGSHEDEYQGYVEGRFTYVAPQVSGKLQQLTVARGSTVHKGQLLFSLDINPEIYTVSQAQAQLSAAQHTLINLEKGKRPSELEAIIAKQNKIIADLGYAKKTLIRYKKLSASGYSGKDLYDKALANYDSLIAELSALHANLITAKLGARHDEILAAAAKVDAQKSLLQQAKWRLSKKMVYAPVSGLVFDRFFRVGEIVTKAQPVISMLETNNVKVLFFVPGDKLQNIKLGQIITVTKDAANTFIKAKVVFISPEAEYTPPIIYSKDYVHNSVFKIEALPMKHSKYPLHVGQPVMVNTNPKAQ
ncbi:MAG: hypothetical protein COB50_01215 [Thiotrichales bacterium]|nr:MAG: hypothetical protein COB50_01215 [Thiotrichales bacterium]